MAYMYKKLLTYKYSAVEKKTLAMLLSLKKFQVYTDGGKKVNSVQ